MVTPSQSPAGRFFHPPSAIRHPRSIRGAVDPLSLVLVVALGLGAAKLAGWKPSELFRKKPPVEQVTKLQADLDRLQAEKQAAEQALAAAQAAERARLEQQARYAQQMNAGASEALARTPAAHRTPETQLASDLLTRSNFALGLALGKLPEAERTEILHIVDLALSKVEDDRNEALAALDIKEADLKAATRERDELKAQIPVLHAQLETKAATVLATQADLKIATGKVAVFAKQADETLREAGSLSGSLERVITYATALAGLWFFCAYVVPPALKFMRPGRTKTIIRNVAGTIAGGLHFIDANRKLKKLQTPP